MIQLIKDYEDYNEVNKQLDKLYYDYYFSGYNIGVRIIEDFLAKTNIPKCGTLQETSELISKVILSCQPWCSKSRGFFKKSKIEIIFSR